MNDYDDIDDMEYELPQAKSLQQSGRSVEEIKSMIKGSVCVYPCYFDRNSSNAKHNGTRRISKQLAIEEPSILYLV